MLLRQAACGIRGRAGNYAVWQEDARLMVMIGRPDVSVLSEALAAAPQAAALLASPGQTELAAAAAPRWQMSGAQRLVHAENRARLSVAAPVRMLSSSDRAALAGLPGEISRDLDLALSEGAASATWVDGRPVSVCYTGWQTESLCDLTIFTQPRHRGRGYAAAAAACLIARLRSAGRTACWLADESNHASLRLARILGFRLSDRVTIFRRTSYKGEPES